MNNYEIRFEGGRFRVIGGDGVRLRGNFHTNGQAQKHIEGLAAKEVRQQHAGLNAMPGRASAEKITDSNYSATNEAIAREGG